jgi:hypothetical protein
VARGWDSKSVQEQIETARAREGNGRVTLTREELEIERKRDGFLLQRTRVLGQLEICADERYKKTLQTGLAYLESQLTELGWNATPTQS